MNDEGLRQLSTPGYWNKRYQEGSGHEWFRTFSNLNACLGEELPAPDGNPSILHLGCGDSTLPAELCNLGYSQQLCVDFSEEVIGQMSAKYPDIEWRVDDVRNLSLPDSDIDVAIDKGTMDAMIHGSQWNPPEDVQINITKYVDEVCRVLNQKGIWIYITYRQPHFVKPQIEREGEWEISIKTLNDGPGTFDYFAYVMMKKDHKEDTSTS